MDVAVSADRDVYGDESIYHTIFITHPLRIFKEKLKKIIKNTSKA